MLTTYDRCKCENGYMRPLLCRLHASAPALLEALEYVMDRASHKLIESDQRRIRAAIRSAKGEN